MNKKHIMIIIISSVLAISLITGIILSLLHFRSKTSVDASTGLGSSFTSLRSDFTLQVNDTLVSEDDCLLTENDKHFISIESIQKYIDCSMVHDDEQKKMVLGTDLAEYVYDYAKNILLKNDEEVESTFQIKIENDKKYIDLDNITKIYSLNLSIDENKNILYLKGSVNPQIVDDDDLNDSPSASDTKKPAASPGASAAPEKPKQSYYIKINAQAQVITIYTTDSSGNYTVPVKAILCSTAADGVSTPLGKFKILEKFRWKLLIHDVWGQYSCRFSGRVLLHSVPYRRQDTNSLFASYFNKLGSPASSGCVRMNVADAKWIYDNCSVGTVVEVYKSADPGPLGKPARIMIPGNQTYDPTDPLYDGKLANNPIVYETPKPAETEPPAETPAGIPTELPAENPIATEPPATEEPKPTPPPEPTSAPEPTPIPPSPTESPAGSTPSSSTTTTD